MLCCCPVCRRCIRFGDIHFLRQRRPAACVVVAPPPNETAAVLGVKILAPYIVTARRPSTGSDSVDIRRRPPRRIDCFREILMCACRAFDLLETSVDDQFFGRDEPPFPSEPAHPEVVPVQVHHDSAGQVHRAVRSPVGILGQRDVFGDVRIRERRRKRRGRAYSKRERVLKRPHDFVE